MIEQRELVFWIRRQKGGCLDTCSYSSWRNISNSSKNSKSSFGSSNSSKMT